MFSKIKKQGLGIVLGAILVSLSTAGAVNAYGPERATFTDQNPASYVTFNSITNNPSMGDERNFVRIREVGSSTFVDKVDIVPGKEYEVWVYYHNNASSTYNAKEHNYKGIALDAKLKMTLPSAISKGATARVLGTISASNSKPLSVWDEATLTSSSRTVALRYIQGSAKITNNGKTNGQALPGEVLFSGAGMNLGYDALNGALPGCTQYSGAVTFKFKADYPDFEISKSVSKAGANKFVEQQNLNIGEEAEFRITYKNTGTVTQNNVTIKDILPAGMVLVPGTTRITTPSDPKGKLLSDNIIGGINIGNYSIGGSATLIFRVKIDTSKLICGANTLTNTVQVYTENGGKTDTAKVVVNRNCTPVEKDKCQIPGKTHLPKNDPKCSEPCKIPGKENLDSKDPNCVEKCKIPGLENLKSNDPNCVQIPSQLPQTGPAEAAAMIIAVVALTSGIAYYMRSRQELKTATNVAGMKSKISSKIEAIKSKILKK